MVHLTGATAIEVLLSVGNQDFFTSAFLAFLALAHLFFCAAEILAFPSVVIVLFGPAALGVEVMPDGL